MYWQQRIINVGTPKSVLWMAILVALNFRPSRKTLFNTRKRNGIPREPRASFNRLEIRNSWYLSGVLNGRKDAEGEDEDAAGERSKFLCKVERCCLQSSSTTRYKLSQSRLAIGRGELRLSYVRRGEIGAKECRGAIASSLIDGEFLPVEQINSAERTKTTAGVNSAF